MTKADQFLKARLDGCRLFGTSQVKDKKKIGRPRSMKPKFDDDAAGTTSADPLENPGADATSTDTDQNE